MTLKDLQNKRICILGYGIENRALVDFLVKKKVSCEITICDSNIGVKHPIGCLTPSVNWNLGIDYDKNLIQYDIIFRIAGYPIFSEEIKKAKKAGKIISNPTKLFFELCPTKKIIGVTGTKGKGTTASLIYAILKKTGKRVHIGGNIGIPMFSFINKIKESDWVVLELSSFQLQDMDRSPKIAVITNLYKEHLAPADPNNPNYHQTFNNYKKAKFNIIKWQKKGDETFVLADLKPAITDAHISTSTTIFTPTIKSRQSKLLGEHNQKNIALAVEVAKRLKISSEVITKAVANFKGLEHRLEFVAEVNNIKYYDDSFSTTPENTIAALNSFECPIILLAGGADKGSNFKEMARLIKKKVKNLVLFSGPASLRIKSELQKVNYKQENIKEAFSMPEAIKLAKNVSQKGDVILLSPGAASFGLFKNYKERGNLFKNEIKVCKITKNA